MTAAGIAKLVRELRKTVPRFQSFSCPEQGEIVQAVVEGDPADVVGILPTGKGKSLCFLLPTFLWKRDQGRALTVVVSPILALMQDQVDAVRRLNAEYGDFHLRAEQLNSTLDVAERRRIRKELRDGKIDVLYLGPETLVNPSTYEMLVDAARNGLLRALVIDEAHIVATWGNEFRTSFKRLGPIRRMLKENCPAKQPLRTLVLSATLPTQAREEVLASLGIGNDALTIEREEIRAEHRLRVRHLTGHDEKMEAIVEDVRRLRKTGPGIIYCAMKVHCDELADLLNAKRLGRAVVFYGDTPGPERKEILDGFRDGKYPVIVATCAFGLGVDKPDVRWVLHFSQPGSIDQYYQEIGRAGRDGKPAEALLYYAPADKSIAKKNAFKVLTTDKFDARLRSMRESAIDVGRDKTRAQVRLVEESTIPSYVEDPEESARRQTSLRAHASWNYATLVRADELGWIRLGPDIISRVACVLSKRATPGTLAARAPTLAALKLLRGLSPSKPVILELGEAAGENRKDPLVLQREFLDLLLGGLVHLPDDPEKRLWDTRVLITDLAARHTKLLPQDEKKRAERQESGGARVDEMAAYAKSRTCRRTHFYRTYGYRASSAACGICDICEGTFVARRRSR